MASLLPALAWWSGPAAANPRGGVVVHGNIAMSGSGGVLNVKQTSANAIIDWEAFSIEAGEMTRFVQPGTNAAVLNRVTGGNASEIHGALRANGNVFVINPNGILVGPGGTIDVHGLVLSTLDIDDGEFLAGGDRVFKGASSAGVTNLGRIHAIGGDVFLIGRTVTNSGSIHAPSGTAGLAAGQEVLIKADTGPDGERIFVRATGAGAGGTGILNDGTIEGAAAELKAHGNHYALAINNKGSIRATGVHRSGGRVHLEGIGGSVSNSGSIRATSSGTGKAGSVLIAAAYAKVDGELRASGGSVKIAASEAAEIGATIAVGNLSGTGGSVDVEAPDIVLKSGSSIDAGGTTGGGSVRIGGGFQGSDPAFSNARSLEMESGAAIHADATETGNGGSVVLWSDSDTLFRGEITALGRGSGRGGMVEVSGKEGLLVDGTVSTLAESGVHGILLLDPRNLTISSAAASPTNLNNSTLASLVVGNHVVVSTFDPGTAEAGHITVLNPVVYTSANSLTLLAEGDLYIGNHVINRGAGDVNLVAGWDPGVQPLSALFGGSPGSPGSATVADGPDMDTLIFDTPGSFGKNGGSVYVGLRGDPSGDPASIASDLAVSVGSRTGQTNVAGHDVMVWGAAWSHADPYRHSQIGYNPRDAGTTATFSDATGRIKVKAVNDVELVSNKFEVGTEGSYWPGGSGLILTGNAAFAQIGHGGDRGSVIDMDFSGDVIVEAGRDVSVKGGKAYNDYAQIGHGGYANRDTNFAKVTSIQGGAITVDAGRDVTLLGGTGYMASAHIGHGGSNIVLSDFVESAIRVKAGGDVAVRGGAGTLTPGGGTNVDSSYARAQIGHGGHNADFVDAGGASRAPGSGYGYKGAIAVDAGGAISVTAGNDDTNSFAVIGHGGNGADGDHSGNIDVTAGTGLELLAGNGNSALFAQIGHIAYASTNQIDGDVRVTVEDGSILLRGGGSTANHAAIGSGGYGILGGTSLSGGTYVTLKGTDATDGLVMESGNGSYAAAHIGHLAQREALTTAIALSGDVVVNVAAGGLSMKSSTDGYFSHTMIGHGGREIAGSKSGDIHVTVASGDLLMWAGGVRADSRYNHTQIGHGGYSNGGSMIASSGSGFADLLDDDGNVVGQRPLGIVVQVLDGDVELLAGKNGVSYAQIGHGGMRAGTASTADFTGDVTVEASGDLSMGQGTASYAYAQIGHGGAASVANFVWNLGGAVAVTAGGSITARGGTASTANAQIGHGGYATTTASSIAASPITVKATMGDVLLLSGTANNTGAKIGHGGYNMKLSSFGESPVTVEAGRHVRLVSPQFDTFTAVSNAGTQIGHGGFGAVVGPVSGTSTLGYSGDITVTAGGKLDVIAGRNTGSYNWSLLGHTSYFNSNGVHRGDITVTTGTTAGFDEYGVTVQAAYGDYLPIAATNTTAGYYYSFAAIGHRGHSNNTALYSTGLHGDILVDVVRGGVLVAGGDGVDGSTAADTPPDIRLHGAQIGHGGYSAGHLTEGISGSVSVHAERDIVLRSGTSRNAVVMIGHGGFASFGPMSGDIQVVSRTGSLELDSTLAINTTRGGVMIGHGAPSPGAGTRQGGILVDVAGEISLVRTVANLSYIGHRSGTANAISNADVTIRGRSFDRATGDSGGQLLRVDAELGTMLVNHLAGGNLSLVGMGTTGIELGAPMIWTSPFDFNLLAYSHLHIVDDLINRGDGDVNVFAGWNPAIAPLSSSVAAPDWRGDWIRDVDADAQLFGVPSAYGNGGGSVWVGAYADLSPAGRGLSVASRTGQTNVAGHDVKVWGAADDKFAAYFHSQIGYNPRDAGTTSTFSTATGRIRVAAVNHVEVAANKYDAGTRGDPTWPSDPTYDNGGNGSFAQIGHGGDREAVRNMQLSGGIVVEAGGSLSLLGGIEYNNHARIGHGGYDNIAATYAATLGGDIDVRVGGDLLLQSGYGIYAHAQIGHGATNQRLADFTESAINVTAGGNVSVKGGPGIAGAESNHLSFAQIGHGAIGADFVDSTGASLPMTSGKGFKGDITIAAGGKLLVESGSHDEYNYALIGHGGFSADGVHSGAIDVTAGNGVEILAGTGASGLFAQIGHLSYSSINQIDGDVRVTVEDGGVLLRGGGSTAGYAAIGSGGYNLTGGTSLSGGTYVTLKGTDATDGLAMEAGNGSYAAAHIGHLAQRESPNTPAIALSGDVAVDIAAGGLRMESSTLGTFAHTMIGHGGRDIAGSKSGDIRVTVASGDLSVKAGGVNASLRYNHAQIGHGGYSGGGAMAASSGSGFADILDGDGNVVGQRPLGILVQVLDGGIDLLAGSSYGNYAQIGHGGLRAGTANTADFTGDVTVEASGDIAMGQGGASYAYAQIGHGGPASVANFVWNLGGAIAVTAGGSVTAQGGTTSTTYSQIGHGGVATTTDSSIAASPISVRAAGDVLLLAGTASTAGAKIGHGNHNLKLSSFGESPISVEAGRHIRLVSPQFDSYRAVSNAGTQIGHGGVGATVRTTDGTVLGYSGDLDVTAGGKIDLLAGQNAATYNWSLIGHTSFNSSNSQGVHSGDITVKAGTVAGIDDYGLVVQAASGDYNGVANANTSYYSFASIGHRGHSSGTVLSGDILVDVLRGGVTVQGGNGQPGTTSDNENTPADLRLHGASIGHGGYNVTSGMSGDVRVHAQGDILLRAGTGPASPALIGHGGRGAGGPIRGLIEVISREGGLELDSTLASNVVAYAADAESRGAVYIGHGASVTGSGTRQGDILVDVAGEISFVGTDRPGWIGHRTATANGIANADVTIRARSIDFASGDSGGGLLRIDSFLGSILAPHLNAGHLSFVGPGTEGIEIGARLVGNSAFDLNLLSRSHIYILDDLLNQGSGDVNVFAGWDPALAPFHPVGETLPTAAGTPSYREYWIRNIDAEAGLFATAGSYGNGGGSVWVGADSTLAAADRSVAVGSRTGQTNVAAHDVHVWGSAQTGGVNLGANKYSQIGYNRADTGGSASDAATGHIRVSALNDVFLEANRYGVGSTGTGGTWSGVDQTGFASFAKIGHGGERDTMGSTTLSGAILVEAGGNLTLSSGQTLESYTMIGHGGPAYTSASVQAIGDITVTTGGSIELLGGEGSRASAQIGHGGAVLGGSRTGNVDVTAGAEIVLRAGAGEDGAAHIGHGGTGAGGLSTGDLRVTAATHLLLEAGDNLGGSVLIGHGGRQASNTAIGAIAVTAGDDIGLLGGGGIATTAQIGHGGYGFNGMASHQSILVEASGTLTLLGGSGRSANAQIGHGGFNSTSSSLTGAIDVQALGGLDLAGGGGLFAYSQIGHFGHASHVRMGGDLSVTSGAHLAIAAPNGADSAYAKIGHGHDLQGALVPVAPVLEITGDIRVAVATDLSLTDGMIGHLNAASTASTTGGDTQIAVGTTDPADPSSGTLLADGQSEFHGADGLRFYLPQRVNNGIAAGALLNGAVFPGAAPDPYDHQRDDEHTIHILGDTPSSPNEHGNAFGTGPAPSNAAGYAFYYDTITLVAGAGLTPPGGGVTPGGGNGPGVTPPAGPSPTLPSDPTDPVDPAPGWWSFFPNDRILDDWLRDREKEFSESGEFEIRYENFHQYGPRGESFFRSDR